MDYVKEFLKSAQKGISDSETLCAKADTLEVHAMLEADHGIGEWEAVKKGLLCSGTVQGMGGAHGRDRGPAAVELLF